MPYVDLETGQAHRLPRLTILQRTVFDAYLHGPRYAEVPCPYCGVLPPIPHPDGCLFVQYSDNHTHPDVRGDY